MATEPNHLELKLGSFHLSARGALTVVACCIVVLALIVAVALSSELQSLASEAAQRARS